jgi:hypothetical protein
MEVCCFSLPVLLYEEASLYLDSSLSTYNRALLCYCMSRLRMSSKRASFATLSN